VRVVVRFLERGVLALQLDDALLGVGLDYLVALAGLALLVINGHSGCSSMRT
jgi:hypothetical protein